MKQEIALESILSLWAWLSFRKIVVGLLLVAAIYGMWVDFIPAERFYPWSLYGAIALSVVIYGCLYSLNRINIRKDVSVLKRMLGLAITFVIFSFGFISVVNCISDTATRIVGVKHSLLTPLYKEYDGGRGSCNYRLAGKSFERAFPKDYFCISKINYASLPDSITVRLYGTESFLGFHIDVVWWGNKELK